MVFGINVSGQRRNTPAGELDVWIPKSALSQVLGLPEQPVKDLLMNLPVLEMNASDNKDDCIVRMKDQQAADAVSKELQDAFGKHPGFYKEVASGGP